MRVKHHMTAGNKACGFFMKKFSKSVEYWHGKKANEVLERDGVCVMCDSDKDLVVHHIESVRGGGKSTLSN